MDADIQVQKNPPPMNDLEFVRPDKPISSINLNNRNQIQGYKRVNEQVEFIYEGSNDELEFYLDNSTTRGKKQKSEKIEKNRTATERINALEQNSKKLTKELGQATDKIHGLQEKLAELENQLHLV